MGLLMRAKLNLSKNSKKNTTLNHFDYYEDIDELQFIELD